MLPEHGYKQLKHVGVVLYSWARPICYENLFIPEYVCYRKHERLAPGMRAITVVVTPAIESDTRRASFNKVERQSTMETMLLTRTVCLLYRVPELGRCSGRCIFLIRQICPAQGHDKSDNVYEVSRDWILIRIRLSAPTLCWKLFDVWGVSNKHDVSGVTNRQNDNQSRERCARWNAVYSRFFLNIVY
jgi:hypothetical protein